VSAKDRSLDGGFRRAQHTTLVVPSRSPAAGAQRPIGQEELAAGRKVLALGDDALVVVDVVLPAVLGLILVREAGVEACMIGSMLSSTDTI
jgi:hypothetical protein